jgi:hypothetical protein
MKKEKSKAQSPLKNRIDKNFALMLKESIPFEQVARKKYMSDIALFYQTIFKDKLQHFIYLQMEELAQIGRTELGGNIIRSNINCFRLIDSWMEEMTNEHIGNVEEIRKSFGESEELINDLQKYNGQI